MSKNTDISELINYVSVNGSGHVVFTTVPSAASNTDKFLVSDSGVLKFRTAAQLLSDIGAQASGSYQAALSGTGFVKISGSTISYDNTSYLPLTGGTLGGGLTINGNTQGYGNLELLSGSGPYTLIGEGTGVNQYGVIDWDASNNRLRIATQPYAFGANGGQITLTTGGLVGIGTTTPQSKLEVVDGTGSVFRAITNGTNIMEIGNYKAGGAGYQQLDIVSAILTFGTGTAGGGSATERMRITSGGNIGIGFTNPQYILHVQDSANTGTIAFGHQSFPGLISCSATTGELRIDNRSSSSGFITFYPNGQTTVGSERMRITPGGNVGIGTSNPVTQLNIGHESHGIGFAYLGASSLPSIAGIFTSDGTAGGQTGYGSLLLKARSDFAPFYSINFFTASSANTPAERMRITAAGALLVNTTSATNTSIGRIVNRTSGTSDPNSILNNGSWSNACIGVEPALYLSSNVVAATGSGGSSQTAKGGIGFEYYSSTSPTELSIGIFGSPTVSSNVRFWNGSEHMRITPGGNIGIGTTSPQQKLSVDGSIRANRSIYSWYQAGTNSWDGFQFLHLKTNMWAGGSPNGNIDYTMSLFYGRLYSYSSNYVREGHLGFHNWSGIIYAPSTNGTFWSGGYTSSDGYVVLVVALGGGTYFGVTIDWHQAFGYPFQNKIVTAATPSNSSSGVF